MDSTHVVVGTSDCIITCTELTLLSGLINWPRVTAEVGQRGLIRS